MKRSSGFGTATALALAMAAPAAGAASITGWNTNNVDVGPTFSGTVEQTGVSTVYDRDVTSGTAGAVTNGNIFYDFPEANSPGIKTVNGPFTSGGNITAGCIMASSGATCDSGFQSGKRFKQAITAQGPIDLVFDVDPEGTATDSATQGYQVFQKLINQSGQAITSYRISLGTGLGQGFAESGANDGLKFDSSFQFGPDDANAYSQFPFGLFGDAATNPNFTLDGFFAPERSGFSMSFSEDVLLTTGFFGPYDDVFGPGLLDEGAVPTGAFFDEDGDPATDDVLIAWLNGDGLWEQRREILGDGTIAPLATPQTFGTLDTLESNVGETLLTDIIEDLANVNVNYAIDLAGFVGDSFTLRLDAGLDPLPNDDTGVVPLPAGYLMLLSALGLGGLAARRRPAA